MKKFRFHWLSGKSEDAEWPDVASAFKTLGYGGGAMAALDYWEELP